MTEHSRHHAIDAVELPLVHNPVAQRPRDEPPHAAVYPDLAERFAPPVQPSPGPAVPPEPAAETADRGPAELQPAGPRISPARTRRSLFFRGKGRDKGDTDAFIERLSRLE